MQANFFLFKMTCTNELWTIRRGTFIIQVNFDFMLPLNVDSVKSLTVICLSQQWVYLHAHLLNEHNTTQHTQSQSLCVVIKGLSYFYACGCFFIFSLKLQTGMWMNCFLKTNKHANNDTYTNMCPFSSAYGCQCWLGKSEAALP